MRLNKFISETGVCSRRQADDWIAAGRVMVNGVVATLGTQVTDGDTVEVDRKPIARKPRRIWLTMSPSFVSRIRPSESLSSRPTGNRRLE